MKARDWAPEHRMSLLDPQNAADGAGGFAESWVSLGSIWAEVRFSAGADIQAGGVEVSRQRARARVRASMPGAPSRPRTGQRLASNGRTFDILGVAEAHDDRFFLELDLVEVTAS